MVEAEAWVMIPKLDKDKTGCIIDMRPLVLCKNCWQNNQCAIQFKFAYPDNPGDWFCPYGKRDESD